ncbi:MAG: amino acid adenylation domain-containing protein [Clostridia bacterium]|nr:amino acid adenylation domain-containing protein [Clostridia bacterium]
MQTNILEYLEATVGRLPDKIAYSNGTDHLTFSELSHHARSIGSALLKKGYTHAPIAILMEKHPNEVAAFFGAVYAGCFYVPLDPEMPAARMETILESVGAVLLIVDKKGKKIAETLHFSIKAVDFEELTQAPIDEKALCNVRETQIDTDPIYIVFTSGSTGVPKGVIACHRSVIDYIETLSEALEFSEDTVFANQTPLFFDAPLKELMPVIKFGATAYLLPRTLFMFPMMLCNFLNEHKINTVCWVVSALTMISSLGLLEKNPPRYLTTVAFGSEVFPLAQYRLWREALPNAKFYNLYGPTEATGMSCVWRAERELAEGEAIPIGRPFRNTDLMLIKEDGTRAKDGETGEIYLRGTCVTHGYYRNPEKTTEAFVQNPLQKAYPETVYRTGDLAYRNAHGEYVFVSRKDAQIKHMGHRIELGEIEAAAAKCTGIRRACCCYDKKNKRIVLYYVGKTEAVELLNELKRYLPRYMLPTLCVVLDQMPLTPNGKLDRKLLGERAETEK